MKTIYAKHLKLAIVFLLAFATDFAKAQTCTANCTYVVGANGNVVLTATTPTFSPAYYIWNFAAGSGGGYSTTYTSNPNASLTYSSNGCYVIGLQIITNTASIGCYNNLQNTVCVNSVPCNATPLTFTTYVGSNGMVSFFNTNGSVLVPISGFSQVWNFGDGGTSTVTAGTSANHTYSVNGTYTVDLTIANTNYTPTCISTGSTVVTVTNVPATCNASFNYSVGANGLVTFSSTSTGSISSASIYTWSFGSQATPSYSVGTNIPNISTTYTANGTYTPYLLIYNPSGGASCITSQTIAVNTAPCSLNANFAYNQSSNGVVNFNNTSTGTTSNTGYHWVFGDGVNSNVASPSHTYASNGTYTVHLIDSTNICSSVYVAIVTVSSVTNTPCNLNTNFTYTTGANGICYFNNTTTGAIAQTTYTWSFGDGNSSSANSPSHTYASNGNYLVTLYANLNPAAASPLACIDSTSHSVIISNITNTCLANTTFSLIPAGSPHYWYAVVTNTANVVAAQWTWGDSTSVGFGIVTSHTYAAAGNYNICLTVTTTCGTIGMHCSSQYLNKTSGESEDIIYINCITPDMLPTGIKNNSDALVSCIIAPNPNSGEFNVSVSGVSSTAKIQVYNLIGELIFETSANESNNGSINKNINLNNALNGVYFIRVSAGDKIHTQKLIVNK